MARVKKAVAKRKPRVRQQRLEGMEDPQSEELEKVVSQYVTCRGDHREVTTTLSQAKAGLIAAMVKLGRTSALVGGYTVELKDTMAVKVTTTGEDEDEE